jgi:Na+-transporting NADH:ubiquinone oxidoreductase subunit NqrE
MKGFRLFIPFLGICMGVCIFLAAGLAVFSISMKLALAIALPITVAIGWLIWTQLIKMMILLEQGGSRALDLDAM